MILNSKLKYVDYLKLISTTSEQLLTSIENQLECIDNISSLLDDQASNFGDTLVLSSGYVLSIDKADNEVVFALRDSKVSDNEILSTRTISLDNIEINSVIGQINNEDITLAQILADAGQSYRLNQVIYNWCETMKAQRTMSKTQAQVIIDTIYNGNTSDESYTQLQLVLTQTAENITFQQFSQVLNIIYSPLRNIENDQSLELRSSITVVKSFIGTSIIQIVSSIGQVISIILSAISKVLGILLSIFFSVFSWLLGVSGVTTKAEINMDSGNWFNTDPLLAFIYPADDFPDISNYLEAGGPAISCTMPGSTTFFWKIKDNEDNIDKIYVNTYLDLNINPIKFCQYLHDNFSTDIFEYINTSSCIIKSNGLRLLSDIYNSDICMQPSDYFSHSDDDNFWAFACALNYSLFRLSFCTNSASSLNMPNFTVVNDNDQDKWSNILVMLSKEISAGLSNGINNDYTNYWKYIASLSEYSITRQYAKNINVSDTNQYMRIPLAGFGDYIVNYYSGFLNLTSNVITNNGLPNVGNVIPDSFSIEYVSQTPTNFFLKYPEYTNDAIVKSVLFIGAVVAVGAITVKAIQIALKPRYTAWSQNKLKTINNLRNQAINTNSNVDWRKYNRQVTWYNAVSSIFGNGAYDPNTGFVNYNANSNNSSSINSFISQRENSKLSQEILDSIK